MAKTARTIMKASKEKTRRSPSVVRIDKSLNKYNDQVLFPEKLAKANEMLRKTGLPKQWQAEKEEK